MGSAQSQTRLIAFAYSQGSAGGDHLDASETKSQLESSLNNSKALSEVAKKEHYDHMKDVLRAGLL
ncbi:hypothetical protein M2R48_14080 [Acinetobacter sp. I-MWF]|nr:hypothetical protein [Acinetobacter sp. I-MWF]MCT9979463.1 hypothetical protein [Acinetobacter sp. I-MWF]